MSSKLRRCYYTTSSMGESEAMEERPAYFEFWGTAMMPMQTPEGTTYLSITVAIIQDIATGEIHELVPSAIRFEPITQQ